MAADEATANAAVALYVSRHLRRGSTRWNRPDRARPSFYGGSVRRHAAKPTDVLVRLVQRSKLAVPITEGAHQG